MKNLYQISKDKWIDLRGKTKVVTKVLKDGTLVFSDGSIGKSLPESNVAEGDIVIAASDINNATAADGTATGAQSFLGNIILQQAKATENIADSPGKTPLLFIPRPMLFDEDDREPYLIIAMPADATNAIEENYEKIYYDIYGNVIIPVEHEWSLTDDGKYGMIFDTPPPANPFDYVYAKVGDEGGYQVPHNNTGRSAIEQRALNIRFIMAQSAEWEVWLSATESVTFPAESPYTYELSRLEGSLIWRPFSFRNFAGILRYTDDYVYTGRVLWAESQNGVLAWEGYQSTSFGDIVPKMSRVYRVDRTDSDTVEAVTFDGDVMLAVADDNTGLYENEHKIIRGIDFDFGGSNMLEPYQAETYDEFGASAVDEEYNRCEDEESDTCYYVDEITSVKTYFGDEYIDEFGAKKIANEIRIPYGITNDDKQTYILFEKDDEMTEVKLSLYVADTFIEATEWEDTLWLWNQDESQRPATAGMKETNGPIVVRKTNYQIIHTHHDDKFNVALYKKITYQDYTWTLIDDCYVQIGAPINGPRQVRRTRLKMKVEHFIVVNGTVTSLEREAIIYENVLTVLAHEWNDPSSTEIQGHISDLNYQTYLVGQSPVGVWVGHDGDMATWNPGSSTWSYTSGHPQSSHVPHKPWADMGFNEAGEKILEDIGELIEDEYNTNACITRVFTNSTSNIKLFVAFDVFNLGFWHSLVTQKPDPGSSYYWTVPQFDSSVSTPTEFPVSADRDATLLDRKWLVFDTGGDLERGINTPKDEEGINRARVNGVILLHSD